MTSHEALSAKRKLSNSASNRSLLCSICLTSHDRLRLSCCLPRCEAQRLSLSEHREGAFVPMAVV